MLRRAGVLVTALLPFRGMRVERSFARDNKLEAVLDAVAILVRNLSVVEWDHTSARKNETYRFVMFGLGRV